ncbi:hypothetical protein DPMN_124929 [Dreissena polymorpha]|uniref:Uncharacterized protein n=1 Tax=Dreissena polymorpha TaxID=45954 RepID=A0A9D4JSM0_DREPO|nr:hypothetical protein DPMN_124929 [Dreissena polymorpha]
MVELFLPLEIYLRTLPKCANLKLNFGITEHDFLAYADRLVKRVKYTMSSDISGDNDKVPAIELEHTENELHEQHQDKLGDMTDRFDGIKMTLSEQIETLQSDSDRLREQWEEALETDSDIKVQSAQEIERPKTALNQKNEEDKMLLLELQKKSKREIERLQQKEYVMLKRIRIARESENLKQWNETSKKLLFTSKMELEIESKRVIERPRKEENEILSRIQRNRILLKKSRREIERLETDLKLKDEQTTMLSTGKLLKKSKREIELLETVFKEKEVENEMLFTDKKEQLMDIFPMGEELRKEIISQKLTIERLKGDIISWKTNYEKCIHEYEKEVQENKRLSMDNEELRLKLSDLSSPGRKFRTISSEIRPLEKTVPRLPLRPSSDAWGKNKIERPSGNVQIDKIKSRTKITRAKQSAPMLRRFEGRDATEMSKSGLLMEKDYSQIPLAVSKIPRSRSISDIPFFQK